MTGTSDPIHPLNDGYGHGIGTSLPPVQSILDEAKALTSGDRNRDYGHPADDYGRTAAMWSAILGVEVTARQAILCMVAVKISRLCHSPDHRDSVVDVAGYADCYQRVTERGG